VNQAPNPQPQPTKRAQPSISLKDRVDKFLKEGFDVIDIIGRKILGDLWETLYLSLQDAIAMGLLVQIPSWLGKCITGHDFTGFDACIQNTRSWWSTDRYICFVMVTSDLTLWAVLAARILIRCFQDFKKLKQQGSSKNAQQP